MRARSGSISDGRRRALAFAIAGCALIAGASGCEVTPEKIQRWKGTEHGPGKLRDALRSSSVPSELRSQAAAALVELGMTTDARDDLKDVPEAQRREIVHGAVPLLVALADGTGTRAAGRADITTRAERDGKDALFALRDWAAPADRAAIDQALERWLTVDLAGRESAGAHSAEQIFAAIGAAAGPSLALVVADSASPEASRMEACRLLGRIGDRAARDRAGSSLVEQARRQRHPSESLLQEIGLVGGDRAVAYLTALADDHRESATVRAKALYSLAQGGDPAGLATALRLAGDKHTDGDVRDAAFELAEKIGPSAVPGLARLIEDKDEAVRWRAIRATLDAGKAQAIPTVLEQLSPSRAYSKEDLRSYVVHELTLIGPAALPALRDELRSHSWVARLVAAMAIGELGRADDAERVGALASDGTRLKGWPGGATVGSESRAIAQALRARK